MGSSSKRSARRTSRPGIESLEGRAVPATFHVANVAQLEAVIPALSNSSTADTLVLAPGEYDLTGEFQVQNAKDLTIVGGRPGNGSTLIAGALGHRVFEIDGGKVTLSGLTISDGGSVDHGGGVYAQNADLTLKNSTINHNSATLSGGGVYVQGGTLNVESSAITNNSAVGGADAFGGGIAASHAVVSVSRGTINNNSAFGYIKDPEGSAVAAGGGIEAQGGSLTIANSVLSNNTATANTTGISADGSGGAVATSHTAVSVSLSTFSNNTVNDPVSTQVVSMRGGAFSTVGGSLTITTSKLTNNTPTGSGEFDHPGAQVILKNSTIARRKFSGNYKLEDKGFVRVR